jgi:CDP-paratose 2-epimerase
MAGRYEKDDKGDNMRLLITGGCGFLGSNLAAYAIKNNYDTVVFDNLTRHGSSKNYLWLKSIGKFTFTHGDIRNKNDIETVVKTGFDAVFHLSGQVAMTTSIENPYKDFEINAMGTLNLLDSLRKYCDTAIVVYSSTNKVYGDLEQYNYIEADTRYICCDFPKGFNETVPLDFRSPYGCSKGSADQYMIDFYRIFGLKTIVFRHSSMYGGRQFATYDQGWVGWFCQKALDLKFNKDNKPFTISGNGKQVRDILHVDDMVSLYYSILESNNELIYGNAYNIGGTITQSLSLLELFGELNNLLNIDLKYTHLPVRISDQKVFIADITKINKFIGWYPKVNVDDGISQILDWINSGK